MCSAAGLAFCNFCSQGNKFPVIQNLRMPGGKLLRNHMSFFSVEALCYEQDGRGFNFRLSNCIFSRPNPSSRAMALESTQPLTEIYIPGIFLRGKGRPALKADKFTAISEPPLYKMWEPRRLTTIWASGACYTGMAFDLFYVSL
jgi:hypothetical protein